jgi:hypothetical protein
MVTFGSGSTKTRGLCLLADIMKVKELYTQNIKMVVGAGMETSFWDDVWCTSHPLKNILPELYDVCENQFISVKTTSDMRWRFSVR